MKLTVEHLLPQQWEAHWPLPPERDPLEAHGRREQSLHTIGNLTLLTKKLNPSLSNGKWERKKKSLKKHSALALNREVCEIESWDENSIVDRGRTHRIPPLRTSRKGMNPCPVLLPSTT